MKKSILLLGAMLAGIMFAQSAHAQSKDAREIRALEARFRAAFQAKNVDAIMSNYAPDKSLFVFDIVPPRQYVGANAYRQDWQNFFAGIPGPILSFKISDLDITTDGTLAFSHSIQSFVTSGKDGKKMNITVRVTDGYRKIGGKWLIVLEHVSAPIDLKTGKADLASKP